MASPTRSATLGMGVFAEADSSARRMPRLLDADFSGGFPFLTEMRQDTELVGDPLKGVVLGSQGSSVIV